MTSRNHPAADKTVNPLSSPQSQSREELPDNETQLEQPDPATETVDKVITPTSIKNKERDNEALRKKERQVEDELRKPS